MTTSLAQQRAARALEQIRELSQRPDEVGKYVSYVSALPAIVINNGLGQALATTLARGAKKPAHRVLYTHVAQWLIERSPKIQVATRNETDKVIDAVMILDEADYLDSQAECLAYLAWLKQFARALLAEDSGDDD